MNISIIKPGTNLKHKVLGEGIVKRVNKEPDGSIVLIMDFNDSMGERFIMIDGDQGFSRFFLNDE